jgi:hypothetical protein
MWIKITGADASSSTHIAYELWHLAPGIFPLSLDIPWEMEKRNNATLTRQKLQAVKFPISFSWS